MCIHRSVLVSFSEREGIYFVLNLLSSSTDLAHLFDVKSELQPDGNTLDMPSDWILID